ncbi:MAG: hypothetical protein Q8L14_31845 [Myxococcales bacterium]|nr:hypothetical protein [Myxococcales bacterium]
MNLHRTLMLVVVVGLASHVWADAGTPGLGLKRAEDEQRLKRVFALFEERKFDAALAELQPVLDAQPELVTMQELACELRARQSPTAVETLMQCLKAGALPGAGPISWLHAATAQGSDGTSVVQSLAKARAAFDVKQAPAFVWETFAELSLDQRCFTWVETAATHLEPDVAKPLLDSVGKQRRRLGLPAGAVPEAREAEFAKLAAEAQKRINLDEPKAAAALVSKAETTFPKVAGTYALRCALDELTKKAASAKKACAAALEAQPDNLVARLVSSALSKPDDAIADLTAIIAADPGYELAYRRLGALYRRKKDATALKTLEAAYQAQFKRPLPRTGS